MDIASLRNEYNLVGLGPGLHALLERIVLSTVHLYPAAEYSPDGTWERAACEDILNDWVFERLMTRGDLAVMLGSAETVPQFRAACTTSLRQFLVNRRRRSIASNLFKRIRDMLTADKAFSAVHPSTQAGDIRWTVSEAPVVQPSALPRGELLRIANKLSDDELQVIRYGPFSQKLSPILRKPQLKVFLTHLLKNSKGSLSLSVILDVIRFRFMLVAVSEQSLLDDVSDEASGSDTVSHRLAAESIAMRLSRDEARLITEYFRQGGNTRQTSAHANVSEDIVNDIVRRAFAMVAELADDPDEAHSMTRELEALLTDGAE
jgi:hypothetical protein